MPGFCCERSLFPVRGLVTRLAVLVLGAAGFVLVVSVLPYPANLAVCFAGLPMAALLPGWLVGEAFEGRRGRGTGH